MRAMMPIKQVPETRAVKVNEDTGTQPTLRCRGRQAAARVAIGGKKAVKAKSEKRK